MPVILQHNRSIELNRIEYRGPISPAEMVALAEYQVANSDWLTYDGFNLIAADADFSAVKLDDLSQIVTQFRQLFEPKDLLIFRRSAWVCLSEKAQPHLDHWITRRNVSQTQTVDARQFQGFAEAAVWLVLSADKAPLLETGEGFAERARLETPAR